MRQRKQKYSAKPMPYRDYYINLDGTITYDREESIETNKEYDNCDYDGE